VADLIYWATKNVGDFRQSRFSWVRIQADHRPFLKTGLEVSSVPRRADHTNEKVFFPIFFFDFLDIARDGHSIELFKSNFAGRPYLRLDAFGHACNSRGSLILSGPLPAQSSNVKSVSRVLGSITINSIVEKIMSSNSSFWAGCLDGVFGPHRRRRAASATGNVGLVVISELSTF